MAIFPVVEETVIDQIAVAERGINFLYDFELNDFIVKDGKFIELTGDAAVVFWIEKCLRTEYEKSAVYENTGYGTVLETMRGKVMPKNIASGIFEDNIKNALLKHERIASINNFKFDLINERVEISFEVELNAITPNEEVASTSEDGYTRLSTLQEIKDFLGVKLLTSEKFLFKTNIGNQVYLNI